MLTRISGFQGVMPSIDATMIPDSAAQYAMDCKLGSGAIKPVHPALNVNTPSKVGTKKSIFLYSDAGTQYWMHWVDQDVNAVKSPIPSDAFKRLYWTGDGVPKMAPLSVAIQGGTGYPTNSYALGLPAPSSVPTAVNSASKAGKNITAATKASPCAMTVVGHGYTTGQMVVISSVVGMTELNAQNFSITVVDADHFTLDSSDSTAYTTYISGGTVAIYVDETLDETRSYLVRFQSAYGEVGPPTEGSDVVTVSPGDSVTLTLPTAAPTGAYNVTHLDIFRTNTGTTGTEYQFVASVALGTATYKDVILSSALGFVLDSTGYLAPNANMTGLIALPGGSLAGFYDNVLCLTPANLPHAWPADGQYSMVDKIVAIGAFGNSILVTTTGAPYVVTGTTYNSMSIERFEEGYSCISKRGLVDMGYSILYPTPIGLYQVGTNGAKLVTDGVCTIDEWNALKPETIHAYAYGGKYFAFNSDNACFVFNPADGTYTQISTTNLTGIVTAGFSDLSTGKLYLMAGSNIVKFDNGSGYSTFTWKSKKFCMVCPISMARLQVFAAGTVTIKIYADSVLKYTGDISSTEPVPLPSGFRATYWEVEITGSCLVQQVLLASTMAELAQV